jgi:hypothetical protein
MSQGSMQSTFYSPLPRKTQQRLAKRIDPHDLPNITELQSSRNELHSVAWRHHWQKGCAYGLNMILVKR